MASQWGVPEQEHTVRFPAGQVELEGDLSLPETASGLVLFAHGSGSGRHSPRNRLVAQFLQRMNLGTLLIDLLTMQEEISDKRTGQLRFNIPFLAQRLVAATDWVCTTYPTAARAIGYFGASTGAAAALVAAAERPDKIGAIVSRGGRPDLAPVLTRVHAPTLLIVGSEDHAVMRLNEQALRNIGAEHKQLMIVPGATHLFEEPGALEQVAQLAADWFRQFLGQPEKQPVDARR